MYVRSPKVPPPHDGPKMFTDHHLRAHFDRLFDPGSFSDFLANGHLRDIHTYIRTEGPFFKIKFQEPVQKNVPNIHAPNGFKGVYVKMYVIRV